MPGFTKLFSTIISSTVWQENHTTRIVWVTLLALADRDGTICSSLPGLARFAGVSLEEAQSALGKFLGPDIYSRTPDREGRRIETIDGGWRLLNYAKYRRLMSVDEKREKAAVRQARKRERDVALQSVTVTPVTPVTQSNDIAEAEAEAEKEKTNTPQPAVGKNGFLAPLVRKVWEFWLTESGYDPVQTKFTDKRRRLIERRLQESLQNTAATNGDPDRACNRLLAAIEGTCHDSFVGQNKAWLTLESILTSQDHFEKGLKRYQDQYASRK